MTTSRSSQAAEVSVVASGVAVAAGDRPMTRRDPEHRLFLDESGDHTQCRREEEPVGTRYLGLVGVSLSTVAETQLEHDLAALKAKHFGSPPVFHRVDIVRAKGAFASLQDAAKRRAFDDDLFALMEATEFLVFAVVIDKFTHNEKDYRSLQHPYHYCLHAMMERYCAWLRFGGSRGDVLAEQRGKKENRELKGIYRGICEAGTKFMSKDLAQARLSSVEIKLRDKTANSAGLQLADMLAHPITREVLVANGRIPDCGSPFGERIAKLAREAKYNRWKWAGKIDGYGRVFLE